MRKTPRKTTRDEVQATEEQLSFAVNAAEVGTWDWDIVSGELLWSDRNRQMFGIAPGTTVTYERFLQAVHPEDRERIDQAVKNALEKREKYDVEMRTVWPDGNVHWNASRGRAYFDESGRPVRMSGAAIDITKLKQTEEELKRARAEAKAQADKLHALNERFSVSLRNTPITVFDQDLDFRYKWIYNPMGGHSVDEIIGKTDAEILDRPEDLAMVMGIKQEVLRTGKEYEGEMTVCIKGVTRSYHVNIDPQRDAQGKICGLTCASFELTERKKLQEERERLAEQLQLALDAAQMGRWHYDAAARVSTWDDGSKRILGLARNSGTGEEIFKLVHPEDQRRVQACFEAAIDPADPKPYVIEYRIVRPDGGERWVEAHGTAEFSGQGPERELAGFGGTVRDVTERKAAEENLRQQRERLEFVAEGSDVGFWFCDLPFDQVIWDKRVKKHFWLPADESPVTMEVFYSLLHPEDREATRRAIENSIQNNQQYDVEYRTVAADGRERWVRANGRTFYDDAGKPVRFDGITQDITARKQAEDLLRASERRLRDLAENLDREVQARTAELQARNEQLLRASAGLKELSGRLLQIQDEERRRVARDLHDSAGQMVTALDLELGNLSEEVRRTAPHLGKKMESFQKLVQQLHREIRTTSYLLHPPLLDEAGLYSALSWYVEGLAQRSGMGIEFDISEGFGRLARDLELAIFRLVQESLTNIHRHSGSQTAAIHMSRSADGVHVAIEDRGKGIPRQRLKKVLEGGSGVGIAGMRERLRQFGGELQIESSERGTRVFVSIPVARDAGLPEASAETLRTAS